MGILDFRRFFDDDEAKVLAMEAENARQVLDWVSQQYHVKFLEWLDVESSKPLPITADLVKAAVRANTFKEIRDHLSRIEKSAIAARARTRE